MTIKKIFNLVLVLTILISISSCQDEWDYSYPFIKSISVENFNDTSALFTGEIVMLGNDDIQEYGYFFAYYNYMYFPCEKKSEEGKFEMSISSILRSGSKIKLGSYAKVNNKIIRGNTISYVCTENVLPEIVSITPISGDKNTIRTIVIRNFYEEYKYYIYFDGIQYYSTGLTVTGTNTIELNLKYVNIDPGEYDVSIFNKGLAEYSEKIIITE
jgi:hypothetical protein